MKELRMKTKNTEKEHIEVKRLEEEELSWSTVENKLKSQHVIERLGKVWGVCENGATATEKLVQL